MEKNLINDEVKAKMEGIFQLKYWFVGVNVYAVLFKQPFLFIELYVSVDILSCYIKEYILYVCTVCEITVGAKVTLILSCHL